MPGAPDPVLGSDALALTAAFAASAVVALAPVVLRERVSPSLLAVGGGVTYALLCLDAWAGARLVADAFVRSLIDSPAALAGLVAASVVVLGTQAAIPAYLYARDGLRAPLAGLFGATTLVLYAFLRVRGESDPLALYALSFGPTVIVGICALALAEVGLTELAGRLRAR